MKINIMAEKFGYVTQVIGPVVDVIFEKDGEDLPPIYEALRIERDNGEKLIIEVEQHIGEDTVRCVAMDTTDGLRRGMKAWTYTDDAGGKTNQGTVIECHRRCYR